jgi:hypothetical protein
MSHPPRNRILAALVRPRLWTHVLLPVVIIAPAIGYVASRALSAAAERSVVLVGSSSRASHVEREPAGRSAAFRYAALRSGTARSIHLYLDRSSKARSVAVGVYTSTHGHPGKRISTGTLHSPKAGRWNVVSVRKTRIRAGSSYWIAVLGSRGVLRVRDDRGASCRKEVVDHLRSRTLPTKWAAGTRSQACSLSAFVSGHPLARRSPHPGGGSSPTPPSTTTTPSPPVGTQTLNCFASPMACGFPDPAAPAGSIAHAGPNQPCADLTQVNGDLTTSSANQVIQNVAINGVLFVNKPGVTVNNVCVITPDSSSGPSIYIEGGALNTLVENTSAGAVDRNSQSMEAAVYNWSSQPATLDHDYFYNCGECIHDGVLTITNSYVIANGMDNSSDHREDIYLSATMQLSHDTLLVPPESTPQVAVVFAANSPNPPSGTRLSVTNSLLAGGDSVLESEVSGGESITNNHFARCTTRPIGHTSDGYTACNGYNGSSSDADRYNWDSHGYWPNGGTTGTGGACSSPNVWTGNVWDDNGSPAKC